MNHCSNPISVRCLKMISAQIVLLLMMWARIDVCSAQTPVENGLIAHFQFDGTAADATTNHNDGDLFGFWSFGTDRFGNPGQCLELTGGSGTGSGVDVPTLDNLPFVPVTYSAWVKISAFPARNSDPTIMTLIGRESCGQQYEGALVTLSSSSGQPNNGITYFMGFGSDYTLVTPPINEWCQIVLTIDANGVSKFYLDGTNIYSVGTVDVGNFGAFRIGSSSGSPCAYQNVWNGSIDDVRIYNRALSSPEVSLLYNAEAVAVDAGCTQSASAVAVVTNGFVVAVNLGSAGCGFTNVPEIAIVGGGGSGAQAVATISDGILDSISVTDAGFGYTNTPQVFIGPPPYILTQPVSMTVSNATSNTLTVVVAGSDLHYQWFFNGGPILGATNSVLTNVDTTMANIGTYDVTATNYFGSVTSADVLLTMYPDLIETFDGFDGDVGSSDLLSVQAVGSGPLSYQWCFNDAPIFGATNADYLLSDIQATNAGLYFVIVSSPYGSAASSPADVVLNPPGFAITYCPVVTIQGVVGYPYAIQRSTNISFSSNWVTMTNFVLTQPIQTWADTNVEVNAPGAAAEFYRVVPVTR